MCDQCYKGDWPEPQENQCPLSLAVPGVQRQMDDGNYSSLFPEQQLNNCREQQQLQRPQSYQETSFADRLILQQGHRDLG